MRRIIFFASLPLVLFALYFSLKDHPCHLKTKHNAAQIQLSNNASLEEGMRLLRSRYDDAALLIFEEHLKSAPLNIEALWAKAEILRRKYKYAQARQILEKLIAGSPDYAPALLSLGQIEYKSGKLDEAEVLIKKAARNYRNNDDLAISYLIQAGINSKRAGRCIFLGKIKYGTNIRSYLLKAKELAPDLADVLLGLGTFYLTAPKIIGGDPEKAIEELEAAIKIAPDFATVSARLAQAYRRKGDLDKFDSYIRRAQGLDPENSILERVLSDPSY